MEKKKQRIYAVIALVALALLVVGATYAYFQNQYGDSSQTDVKVTTYTTDLLTFETGSAINITADQDTFAKGKGNQTGSSFTKAILQANSKTNVATANYYVYLLIENNEFSYSESDEKPELILSVTDSSGASVTIDNLTKKTVTDGNGTSITGYDITLLSGLITLLNNKTIEVTSSDNGKKEENWNVTLTLVNYDFDQNNNAGKNFDAKLIIQKEVYPTVVGDVCNDGDNLAGCITTLSNKSDSLVTNVYHHDGSIKDSEGNVLDAEDGSYRYAGFEYDDLYSCKYNGEDVKHYSNHINENFASSCDKIYEVTKPKTNTKEYYDGYTFSSETFATSWDDTKNACVGPDTDTTNGSRVIYYQDSTKITKEECGKEARKSDDGTYIYGVTEVGSGVKSLTRKEQKVNNYVCFGYDTTDGTCPSDNLYRIIGVFNNQIKLIKADFATSTLLGTDGDYKGKSSKYTLFYKGNLSPNSIESYYFNYNGLEDKTINKGYGSGDWSTSLLNKVNLNTNFLNNIGSKWSNIIVPSTWYFGQITTKSAKINYQSEIQLDAYQGKVGIIRYTDYEFSISPNYWGISSKNYPTYPIESWLMLGTEEYTNSTYSYVIFCLYNSGILSATNAGGTSGGTPIRPNFYLDSSVQYSSGKGTKDSPIILKIN